MDAASSKLLIVFVLLALHGYLAEGRNESHACVDGTYEHDRRSCCLCNTGQYLKKDCATDLQYGECENCAPDTYSIQPNNMKSCDDCTSCTHPNANLQVKEPCTSGRDAKCECKTGHYCSSGTEPCRICNPCKECPEGIEVKCSANADTVCSEGGNKIGVIVGSVFGVLGFLAIAVLAYFMWKRCWKRNPTPDQPTKHSDVELQPIIAPVVELQKHLTEIVDAIGWKDMQFVAMHGGIQNPVIESCQLNHPQDSQEQTLELLKIWMERQGKEASRTLIRTLENNSRRGKAEKVRDILSGS